MDDIDKINHADKSVLEERARLYAAHAALHNDVPQCPWCQECPGHHRGGKWPSCCSRAGEYNGFGGDGPLLFVCPISCSCHD